MLELQKKTTEVYQATNAVVRVSSADLDFLAQAITLSPRKRARICTHRSTGERLHEMFVIYSRDTYVRPNKHLRKDESVFAIRGAADFVFFDDQGAVTQVVPMGDGGNAYYCRVPAFVFHTILIRSPDIMLFEATPGPFDSGDTIYADWAPTEGDAAVASYLAGLEQGIKRIGRRRGPLQLRTVSPLVLVAEDEIAALGTAENELLTTKLRAENLDRVRICCHKSHDDRLHEMLMAFSGDTYVRPSLHIDRDESLYVLEGHGTYLFFDPAGRVTRQVHLGPAGSGKPFYCRIPANTYHSLVVESDCMLVKEAATGPFSRAATHFAPWAPATPDRNYIDSLRAAVAAGKIRARVVRMSHEAKAAHLGSALSCVDILAALYWGALRIDPKNPLAPDRDRLILSKGHAAAALYTALAYRGFFDESVLDTYNRQGSALTEHPSWQCVPGVEAATGSLGHGLSLAVGMALAQRILKIPCQFFVVLSDGECNEGSTWEAAMLAAAQGLDNLTVIVDYNKWQATGRSDEIMALDPLADKWRAFGWSAYEVDGHDHRAILAAIKARTSKPVAVIAHTIKGNGVSFMEDNNNWHYRIPTTAEVAVAMAELGAA